MDSKTSELAACPFCGGAAHRRELIERYPASADGPAGSYSAWFHIGCDACGIEVGDEYESTAIAAWNRRAATSARSEEIAGLRAALEQIAAIEDRMVGGDWEEIEEARQIARAALTPTEKPAQDVDAIRKVALDIARWFVNGDRPDEWKLKEWAESLHRGAIDAAYTDRADLDTLRAGKAI